MTPDQMAAPPDALFTPAVVIFAMPCLAADLSFGRSPARAGSAWALDAVHLHVRTTAGRRRRPAAWVDLVALASLVLGVRLVNLVSTCLRSSGGVS